MGNNASSLIHMLTKTMDHISQLDNHDEINAVMETLLIKFTNSDWVNLFLYESKTSSLYQKKEHSVPISMKKPYGLLGNVF